VKLPDKRDKIIRAALELIAEYGFHGAPMSMIAERAAVGAGTIYRYFKDKDELIREIFKELIEYIRADLVGEYPTAKPYHERFIYLFRTFLKYFLLHPLHFRFLEQYFNSPYGVPLRREKLQGNVNNVDIFDRFLKEGIKQNYLKRLPLFIMVALVFGPVVSLARDHSMSLIEVSEDVIDQFGEACWDAIKK
jgi:AcrR family transcriptional regulator